MDFLKRCSGSTICCYVKRCQRFGATVLYHYNALPQAMQELTFGRTFTTAACSYRPMRIRHATAASYATFPAQSPSEKSSSHDGLALPDVVLERLKHLQTDIIASLLEHPIASGLAFNATPSNFSKSLEEMAKYYFDQGGKLFRPVVSLLMANVCNEQTFENNRTRRMSKDLIDLNQYRIAMISEMIHTASLVHDDVIDESDRRRGQPTVNARWGNRQAVLVGDFILARATKVLCTIGQPKVISVMAEIVEDLVKGELMQLTAPSDLDATERFQHYMMRTFYKTASLFANSCKSVAMLAECNDESQREAFEFGRNLGLAFQLVDDLLDYVASSAVLGKPAATDLKLGLATCPVLFAAQDYPELNALINRRFAEQGDVTKAYEIVLNSRGLDKTRQLAREHCSAATNIIRKLPANKARDCLIEITMAQLERDR